jgi:hypothetical protein
MKEFIRYRIDAGPRCTFDSNTIVRFGPDCFSDSLQYLNEEPVITNVIPNEKLNFFGISVNVPEDASKMVKWYSDSVDTVVLLFLKEDGTLVDNAFAYHITMDN